jgi:hypothetical protein
MGVSAENQDLGRGPAEPCFAPKAIDTTLSGTETAVLKDAISLLDSLSQDALVLQFLIGWPPSLFLFLHGMKGERRQKQGASQEKGTLDEAPACNLHTRHLFIRLLKLGHLGQVREQWLCRKRYDIRHKVINASICNLTLKKKSSNDTYA